MNNSATDEDKDIYLTSAQATKRPHVLLSFIAVFLISVVVLVIGTDLRPGVYDESIVLTGAMRVAAGQIPHRDFYAIYGPAQFYLLAALFKLFGQSLLAERILDLFIKGILIGSIFTFLSKYCRLPVVLITTAICLLWLYADGDLIGNAVIPVSLFNLLGIAVLVPVFTQPVSNRRLILAGALAGIATLFRFDTGVALLGVEFFSLLVAALLERKTTPHPFATLFSRVLFCGLGFLIAILPLLYYVAHVPWSDFAHDLIIFPAKYYKRARNLPFPIPSLQHLGFWPVYLPILIVITSAFAVFQHPVPGIRRLRGFLIAFSLLTLVMYAKGWVRISTVHMYLCTIPSLVILAVLFQNRSLLSKNIRVLVLVLAGLSVFGLLGTVRGEARTINRIHSSVPARLVALMHHSLSPADISWCNTPSPITKGICFEFDPDEAETLRFIDAHTTPDQTLFVGLPHHDRILMSNNLLYFAAQRLPATKWSDFNTLLQSSLPIQTQMVQELERNRPPYIVLDSEFESLHEPNESDKSTGVLFLDQYIQSKYSIVATHGTLTILQRTPGS